jgi:hypothetical protein
LSHTRSCRELTLAFTLVAAKSEILLRNRGQVDAEVANLEWTQEGVSLPLLTHLPAQWCVTTLPLCPTLQRNSVVCVIVLV